MSGNENGRAGHWPEKSSESELAWIVDELAERARLGEKIDWPLCYKRYRLFAGELKELSPAIEIVARIGSQQRRG